MAIENIKELESSMKLEEGTIQKAIDSEESVKIELQEGLVIRTAEDDATFMNNKQAEFKTEFHTAGREIAIKEKARELGLELPKGKNMDSFTEAIVAKTLEDAKVEPNKRIEELEGDKKKLVGNLESLQGDFDAAKNKFNIESQQRQVDTTLLSNIKGDLTQPAEDLLILFKAKHSSKLSESGALEISKGGDVMKNPTTLAPLTPKEVMGEFLTQYIKKPQGGAGGDDATGAGAKGSMEAFQKEMTDSGVRIGSEKFVQEMQKRLANKTLKS